MGITDTAFSTVTSAKPNFSPANIRFDEATGASEEEAGISEGDTPSFLLDEKKEI